MQKAFPLNSIGVSRDGNQEIEKAGKAVFLSWSKNKQEGKGKSEVFLSQNFATCVDLS